MRKKLKTVADGWVPNRHGIRSSYNRDCRCDECRAVNAAAQARNGSARRLQHKSFAERELIDGRLVHPKPYGGHGSLSAYNNCGCRCDACREAKSRYTKQHRVEGVLT